MQNPLEAANIESKIAYFEEACHQLLNQSFKGEVPFLPARDIQVVTPREMPSKKGLSYLEGQGQMLHDLANIELQAAELGLRTLIEFKNENIEFREQLAEIILQEVSHLKLCLEGLDLLGFSWGDWPVHLQLWSSTNSEDDILDRILIVHRYLEGAGLDASSVLMNRLQGVDCNALKKALRVIAEEEEGHVQFGSQWFQTFCHAQKRDPEIEFCQRFQSLLPRLPRRMERMNVELRKKVGFTDKELQVIQQARSGWMNPN